MVAAVSHGKSRTIEELAKVTVEVMKEGQCKLVRSVTVRGEREFIQALVTNVSNDNEADVIVLVGGTGFGPNDEACEAIESFCDRRIEGFAEGYRRLLREDCGLGPRAALVRATAGVYNKCVVVALTGSPTTLKRGLQSLVLPILPEAVELATGRRRAHELHRPTY
jgi:molybdenum cofactor synthesis domain-containing protein